MYGFININQKGLTDYCNARGIKIDLVDATLLSYIASFVNSTKTVKRLIDNIVFSWIDTNKIIEDNPLLGIKSKDVINRRINKLVEADLLLTYLSREEGNKKYYAISDNLHSIIVNDYNTNDFKVGTLPTQKSEPTYSKVGTLPTEKSEPLPTQKSYNSNIYNSNINSNKKINKKSFSFSLNKAMQFENLSQDYKQKLKARLLLEFGTAALDKLEEFELSCISNGYRYKNFYAAFKKWFKDKLAVRDINSYKTHPQLSKDFVVVGTHNNKVYAVNKNTLEMKIGKVVVKESNNNSYVDNYETENNKSIKNHNVKDLLSNTIKRI